jgi:hypothetical protein
MRDSGVKFRKKEQNKEIIRKLGKWTFLIGYPEYRVKEE